MASFLEAYDKTNKREGMVLSDVPTDRGGMTFGGISRVHHPKWPGWELIDRGTRRGDALLSLHRAFYVAEFWSPLRLGELNDQEIAEKVYDAAVNCGGSRAVRWLQVALNTCNQRSRAWPDLIVDGRMGANTIAQVNGLRAKDPRRWLVLQVFETQQEWHYLQLAINDESQEANLLGWYTHRIHHRKEA